MTWPDYIVIVLVIGVGLAESRRGFVTAFFDLLGVVITVEIAGAVYRQIASPSLSYTWSYIVCVLIGVVVIAGATSLLKRQTQMDIGSFDTALAGLLGVFSALALAHATYGAVVIQYGMNHEIYAGSALAGQIYELNGIHGFLAFMGKIGTTEVAQ